MASTKPTVVVMESIHEDGIEILKRTCTVRQLTGPSDPALATVLPSADALIVRSTRVSAELIQSATALRVIGRHGAGTDNIDLAAARACGVTVVNTPRSNTESVAEYVITVALMMLKRIDEVSVSLRSGGFSATAGSLPGQVDRAGLNGREAGGIRLGLIGAGAIGRSVAKRAQALGMHVWAYDPFLADEAFAELGIERVTELNTLLGSVDIVSLHVPGGNDTALIGAAEFAVMKKGSMLINAARGDLVDTAALIQVLESGRLAAAAVDVHEPEPPLPGSPIFTAPRLILTPHMAAMTTEALRRMSVDVANSVVEKLTTHAQAAAAGQERQS